jgi:hypothetical protein
MKYNVLSRFVMPLLLMIAPLAQAQAPDPPPTPRVTGVLVMLTAKPGVARQQILKIMPNEVRATVRLYLDGRIRQWYSRGDGRGVVFILDCKDTAEAKTLMESLPLAAEHLVDYEYIPIGPLMPLGALLGDTAKQ